MNASQRPFTLVVAIAVTLLASACSAAAVDLRQTTGSSSVPSAALVAQPTATLGATPLAAPSLPTPAPSTTVAPTPESDVTPLDAGPHSAQVMGGGSYPGFTVVVPAGWYDRGGRFVVKYPGTDQPGPVMGLSVWDVGQVYRDPCHWQGTEADPGPGVQNLVAALVAQPMRHATSPKDVSLAGHPGRYLELSVPADLKSSTWTDFDACDIEPSNGHHDFRSWLGNGLGTRYLQAPGQVDRLWVLDVDGQRLVVDATYTPDTTPIDRNELAQIVKSIRFVRP